VLSASDEASAAVERDDEVADGELSLDELDSLAGDAVLVESSMVEERVRDEVEAALDEVEDELSDSVALRDEVASARRASASSARSMSARRARMSQYRSLQASTSQALPRARRGRLSRETRPSASLPTAGGGEGSDDERGEGRLTLACTVDRLALDDLRTLLPLLAKAPRPLGPRGGRAHGGGEPEPPRALERLEGGAALELGRLWRLLRVGEG